MTFRGFLRSITPAQLVVGFVLASLFMVGAGTLSYRQSLQVMEAARWRRHTLEVIGVIKDVGLELHLAETAQRRYVITAAPADAEPVARQSRAATMSLGTLRRLTADNREQQQRLAELAPLMERRLQQLEQTIALRERDGFEAVRRAVLRGNGQRLMDDIDGRLAAILATEERLLSERDARLATSGVTSTRTVVAGTALSLGLVALLCSVLAWQTRERSIAEATARIAGDELRLAHAANQQLMDHSLDVICRIDGDGCFRDVSAASSDLWGYAPEELIGRDYMDFVHAEDRARTAGIARSIMDGVPTSDFENRYIRKNGEVVDIMWSATWSSEHDAMFCVARDVTAHKAAERALRDAMTAAEAATRAKSEFLANMSHEIRTPLTGVLGMLELMRRTALTADQGRYVDIADTSAKSLLGIVNATLDLSKIEAGRVELDVRDFDLDRCLESGLATLAIAAQKKGLTYACVVDDDVPRALAGDAGKLQQVLVNLLGNAVKFTVEGGVSVRVSRVAHDDGILLRFTVADTGIGIPVDRRAAVFEPFTQADGLTTRQYGGTGLGLTIAMKLAGLLGGDVQLDPLAERGTTFHVSARFAPAQATTSAAAAGASGRRDGARHERPLRILVAEDTESIRVFLVELLAAWGHQVTAVGNGVAAVESVVARPPDLVLMDAHMPKCDGLQATGLIRAHEYGTSGHVPIIALTAKAMAGDCEACLRAGMDDYLTKPVQPAVLFQAIAAFAGASRTDVDAAAIIENAGGDRALVTRLAGIFLDESARLMDELEEALASRDIAAVEQIAHRLKGSIGHWSAGDAHEAAGRIEAAAREGRADGATAAWGRLQEAMPRARAAVTQLVEPHAA